MSSGVAASVGWTDGRTAVGTLRRASHLRNWSMPAADAIQPRLDADAEDLEHEHAHRQDGHEHHLHDVDGQHA